MRRAIAPSAALDDLGAGHMPGACSWLMDEI
jgi:hypothetical protein